MSRITKRASHLADGRELIYFDDADTHPAGPSGRRMPAHLPARAGHRHHAPGRADRRVGVDRGGPPEPRDAAAGGARPAGAGERRRTRPRSRDIYDVAVFENRSPVVRAGARRRRGARSPDLDTARIRAIRAPPSDGARSCASPPSTQGSFGSQSVSRARTVIEAWADRTAALSALPGIEQVFPFENRGEAIGVTLHHPHGQIYAYPYITPRTTRLLESARRRSGRTCSPGILAFEQDSERMVLRGEHWSAFVPFAARWPIEVHMLPHRQVPDFAATNDAERDELAVLYRRLLRGIDALYDSPTPVHRRLAPGARARRAGRHPAHAAADLAAACGEQAQVPRRLRSRHGRLDWRRSPRRSCRH